MIKKTFRIIGIIFILLLLTPIITIQIVKYNNNRTPFKKIDLNSLTPASKEHLRGESQIELARNILFFAGSEGDFAGSIQQFRLKNGDILIILKDDYVPDDSIGPSESRFLFKEQNNSYIISEYSIRNSCHRYPTIWQELFYIFISPLWTEGNCG